MKIDKALYKKIKNMSREEMKAMLDMQFSLGFNAGVESSDNADFKIKLVEVLNETKGVGEKTINNVLATLKEMEE